jgi:hypothetical protein
VRADRAFYSRAVLDAAVKLGVEFSVIARFAVGAVHRLGLHAFVTNRPGEVGEIGLERTTTSTLGLEWR